MLTQITAALGEAGGWIGGHINMYDESSVLFNGYLNIDNGQANNDGTTVFAVDGGTLALPEGFITLKCYQLDRERE